MSLWTMVNWLLQLINIHSVFDDIAVFKFSLLNDAEAIGLLFLHYQGGQRHWKILSNKMILHGLTQYQSNPTSYNTIFI